MSARGNKPRPDLKEMRQKEAVERQATYEKKSVVDVVAELDLKYGPGQGAKKQRAKLAKKLEAVKPAPAEKKAKK